MRKFKLIFWAMLAMTMVTGMVHSETILKALVKCEECDGKGSVEKEYDCHMCKDGQVNCSNCAGTGREKCDLCNGTHEVKVTCRDCSGTGRVNGAKCEECDGEGKVLETCASCESDGKRECHYCDGEKTEDCMHCAGKGYTTAVRTCTECGGDGKVEE